MTIQCCWCDSPGPYTLDGDPACLDHLREWGLRGFREKLARAAVAGRSVALNQIVEARGLLEQEEIYSLFATIPIVLREFRPSTGPPRWCFLLPLAEMKVGRTKAITGETVVIDRPSVMYTGCNLFPDFPEKQAAENWARGVGLDYDTVKDYTV